MLDQFGPWATWIDAGGNPQLSTFWRHRLKELVPASRTSPVLSRRSVLWLGAATLLVFLSPTLSLTSAAADKERPGVFVYQAEPKTPGGQVTDADMERLLAVVKKRVETGSEKLATVRQRGDRQVEVTLARQDEATAKRVKDLLARPGTLEFRILANTRDNKELIARAMKEPSNKELLDASGKREGWWVPVIAADVQSISGYRDIATRTVKKDDREVTEVLVVTDPYNVTGDYLKRVEASKDNNGRPAVNFTFNKKGGELFGELTKTHLPDEASPENNYKLGVILDGELFSAPSIHSVITEHGEITGSFTEKEVADLASTLNAGSLPVQLRLVSLVAPSGHK
jgi:SecD/SecF fusion protein